MERSWPSICAETGTQIPPGCLLPTAAVCVSTYFSPTGAQLVACVYWGGDGGQDVGARVTFFLWLREQEESEN